jgi:hypothetical protein
MTNKDFAVGVTGIPSVGHISKKPCYLIVLEDNKGKLKTNRYFITIDKPDLQINFVQAKGIYCDLEEDEIIKRFSDVLTGASKESIIDVMFPSHRIYSIRSLVFNANKPSSLLK